jgi:serine/threonine-protein kinase
MVLGTPPYMSPEQFTGKAFDVRSDIYSLGVMSYEMLTGKLPFEADTPWQWATQHMTAQPTPFEVSAPAKSIPHGMRDAIMKSLNKDREKRQASARDFFAELSGGGRMTVTGETGAKAGGSSSTAAMEAAPDFGAHSPAPHSPPAGVPVYGPAGGHGGHGVPPTAPGVVAAVPPPPAPTRGGQGGGKGLIIGLGAVGGVLLIAMAIVAAKSMKKDGPDTIDIGPTATNTGPNTTIQPLIDAGETVTPTPPDTASDTPDAAPSGTPTGTPKPTGTGPKTTPTPSATADAGKPATGADAACDACIAAAKSGNIAGAKSNFDRCSDPAQKKACTREASRLAPNVVNSLALQGKCDAAKVVIAAGKSMQIPANRLEAGLKGSSCKP